MGDVICVDGNFPQDALDYYNDNKVVTPTEGKVYSIREVKKHTTGEVGVLLEEIVNPPVEFSHPILGTTKAEPTWNLKRFSTLLGDEVEYSNKKKEDKDG